MYPSTSNFMDGAPGSAWWRVVTANGQIRICETQGKSFVYHLQTLLREKLTGTFLSASNQQKPGSSITVDGILGFETLSASLSRANEVRAPSTITHALGIELERLQTAPVGRPLSLDGQRALIWIVEGDPSMTETSIDLPTSTVTLQWKKKPSDDGDYFQKMCCHMEGQPCVNWTPLRSTPGAGPPAPGPAPTPNNSPSLPNSPTVTAAPSEGLSTGEKAALAALGVVLLGIGVGAALSSKKTSYRGRPYTPRRRSSSIVIFR